MPGVPCIRLRLKFGRRTVRKVMGRGMGRNEGQGRGKVWDGGKFLVCRIFFNQCLYNIE